LYDGGLLSQGIGCLISNGENVDKKSHGDRKLMTIFQRLATYGRTVSQSSSE